MVYTDGQIPTADDFNNYTPETITFAGSAGPPSAASGKMYYDTGSNVIKYYNGSDWLTLGANQLWWADSNYYEVYDDFENESLGTFSSNSKWTITPGSNAGTAQIVDSQYAGGSNYELKLKAQSSTVSTLYEITAKTLTIPSNRHIWGRFAYGIFTDSPSSFSRIRIRVGNATDGWTNSLNITDARADVAFGAGIPGDTYINDGENAQMINIVSLGSDTYDVYIGAQKTNSALSLPNGPQIEFYLLYLDGDSNDKYYQMYIDDIRYSKYDVV